MKNLAKSKERTLVKTTMVAMFITALLLISSVNAAPLVTQPSNEVNIQELNELQAHENNIPIKEQTIDAFADLVHPTSGYRSDDVGVVSIDAPISGAAAGAFTPKATIKNNGTNDLVNVPVHMQIGNTSAPPYNFFDFESNDGGWLKSASWAPYIGDWEWTNTYDVANYVYGGYPASEKPPLTAYSGTGLWGTIMYAPYTNAGGFSYLSQTFDFSGFTNPVIQWRSWEQVFGNFDYCQLRVNGNLVWGPSWDYQNPEWRLRVVNLTAYAGQSSVEIKFEMYATTVVNYAGWYIDDVLIGDVAQNLLGRTDPEYNQTAYININAGQTMQVEFPTWNPEAWHNQESVTIHYAISVETQLVNDTNPNNDLLEKAFSLHYGPYHDIALTSIIQPVSGNAREITPEVVVKNLGQYDEVNVPINMVISKPYFMQDFVSTTFPPAGWTQEASNEWRRVTTANAGGTSPEARLYYSYIVGNFAYLQGPAVDTTGDTELFFEFRSMIQNNYGGSSCKVLIRGTASGNWTDITPWANPINANVAKAKYVVDISAHIGNGTQVRFQFNGTSAGINSWYLDDIFIYQLTNPEYDSTQYISINAGVEQNVLLPTWTPSDLGVSENVTIFYSALAESQLANDNKTSNNMKTQDFTLSYSFIHEVAITEIISPASGLAQIQPVKVALFNNGQNDETVFVNVVIEKFNGTAEDFEATNGGYVPSGTGTGLWEWGTPTSGPGAAHSGSKLWATGLAGNYGACNVTLDKAVTLPAGSVSLTFWHWYDTEASYDGGNVKISTNNGTTWTLLMPDGGYTGAANSAHPFPIGEPIWTGHGQKYWEKETFDLTAYAGQSVIVRWHFGADPSVHYPGWYIDDVMFADPSAFLPEYDQTVSVDIDIGETLNVTLPTWTPSDMTLSVGIEYRATATATIGGFVDVASETFNTFTAPYYAIPTEWTKQQSNPTSTWFIETTNTRARCSESGKLGVAQNEWLISPPFNTIGTPVVKIQYSAYLYHPTTTASYVEVLGSIDGGVTWPTLIATYTVTGSISADIDISAWAANKASVNIAYRFISPADANTSGYFYFDNFWIGNEVAVISEFFNNYIAGKYYIPPEWTVQTLNPTGKWWMYQSGTSIYPRVNESGSDGLAQDEWMISPVINCSANTGTRLQYTKYFYRATTGDSTGQVLGSIDGGTTWTKYIINYTATSSTAENIDISSWADGQANVRIAFRFISTAETTLTDYWYFDNFFVGKIWGPFGDNPPTGWTILNYGSQSPQVWDNNDWHRYALWGGNIARVYYSPVEQQNEWLITPTIDCTGLTTVSLSFNHYFYWGAAADYGAVEGSTDNGATWTQMIVNFTYTDGTSATGIVRTYDISSWAAGQSQVKIRFRYYANNDWYWYVDDVTVKSGTTTILYENFEGVGYLTGFDTNYVAANWGPLGWQIDPSGAYGDLRWNVQNTANAGGAAPEARFYYYSAVTGTYHLSSGPLDTTGYTAMALSFKEKTTHSAVPYYLNVSVSTDGITWNTVLSRSPTATINAHTEVIQLTAADGIGSSTFRVRFSVHYVAPLKITYWYIDDVKLGTMSTLYTTSFDTNYVPENWGPLGWTRTHTNWAQYNGANAGGIAPELRFYYSPSFTGDSRMYTGPIDTTGETDLQLTFKHFVDHYAVPYTLKVETSTDGVTWNTVWSIDPTANVGPATVTIDLDTADGVGSSTFRFSFTFSGYTFNIDYWYIDDVKLRKFSTIPDGNPANNVLQKWFTLTYAHDVGVSMIVEPIGPASTATLDWYTGNAVSGVSVGGTPFEAAIRFNETDLGAYHNWSINTVKFFKGYGTVVVPACSGEIKIYSGTNASTLITTQPWSVGDGSFLVTVPLSNPVKINPGVEYWVSVHYASYVAGSYPGGADAGPAVQTKGDWVSWAGQSWAELYTFGINRNWCIEAVLNGPVADVWPPGTYPVSAVINNFGVTFSETNFEVNAKLIKLPSTVVYEENVTVTNVLGPGQFVVKVFPDFTIENLSAWEGDYRLEVKTMLAGDDQPSNDKKTKTFTIEIVDVIPPVTSHSLAGTMGNNDWYRSDVTITLTAIDPTPPFRFGGKGPSGVDYIMIRIDAGASEEYTTPVKVTTDGTHQFWYYAVDNAGNEETEKGPFSFKIDKTGPVFTGYTFTPLNAMKSKWLCAADVDDATSGVVLVEFYVDDALVGSATEAPWEFTYNGKPTTSSQAIAYDAAGNSAMSELATSVVYIPNSQNYAPKAI